MADVIVNTPTIAGREAWLAQAVASVAAQTIAPLDHRVELDTGHVGAWGMHNRLVAAQLDAAGGPRPDLWILNLDDDNALAPNYLEQMTQAAATADDDIAVVYSWPYVTLEPDADGIPVHHLDNLWDPDKIRTGNTVDLCALIRSTAWTRHDGLSETVAFGDWDLWLNLLDDGWNFLCVPRRLWYYRLHRDNLSHTNNALVRHGTLAATHHHHKATP